MWSSMSPIPVAPPSKAWICDNSLVGIAGPYPAGGTDACLLWADHSSRGVLYSVVCLRTISKPRQRGAPGPLGLSAMKKKKKKKRRGRRLITRFGAGYDIGEFSWYICDHNADVTPQTPSNVSSSTSTVSKCHGAVRDSVRRWLTYLLLYASGGRLINVYYLPTLVQISSVNL